jgi:hypothetical protein
MKHLMPDSPTNRSGAHDKTAETISKIAITLEIITKGAKNNDR